MFESESDVELEWMSDKMRSAVRICAMFVSRNFFVCSSKLTDVIETTTSDSMTPCKLLRTASRWVPTKRDVASSFG